MWIDLWVSSFYERGGRGNLRKSVGNGIESKKERERGFFQFETCVSSVFNPPSWFGCKTLKTYKNAFWVFSTIFFLFENSFSKIEKRTRFHHFKNLKTENDLKTIKRTAP